MTIDIFGSAAAIDRFAARLLRHPPPAADIRDTRCSSIAVEPLTTFSIVTSDDSAAPALDSP